MGRRLRAKNKKKTCLQFAFRLSWILKAQIHRYKKKCNNAALPSVPVHVFVVFSCNFLPSQSLHRRKAHLPFAFRSSLELQRIGEYKATKTVMPTRITLRISFCFHLAAFLHYTFSFHRYTLKYRFLGVQDVFVLSSGVAERSSVAGLLKIV